MLRMYAVNNVYIIQKSKNINKRKLGKLAF